jgi:peroxiredoxin
MKKLLLCILLVLSPGASQALVSEGPAANFTLKSASGENIRLSEYVGQVVLINFWASWCGPCRQEMPELEQIQQRYSQLGFTVFGVNVEQDREMADKVLRDIPVSFPILFDDTNAVSELYGVDAMPATVLVDRNGVIRHMHRGYTPGMEALYEQQIRQLIRE